MQMLPLPLLLLPGAFLRYLSKSQNWNKVPLFCLGMPFE